MHQRIVRPNCMRRFENEIALILACSAKTDPSELAARVDSLAATGLDWDYIFQTSYRNAVFPLVYLNLIKASPSKLPVDIRADILDRLKGHTAANMLVVGQLFRIKSLFDSRRIPMLSFKGPLLSIQAYGDPTLRMFGDLDLLVQPKHLDNAIRLLEEAGYQPLTTVSWIKRSSVIISRQKDVRFAERDGQTILELHWKLSGSHFGLPKEMNQLWERLESLDIAGTKVPNLSFNDLLIYLCLHGSRHSWERLSWICDIYHLLLSREEIDWASIFAESKSLGCENVVALGLKLVQEFFSYKIPKPFTASTVQEQVYDEIVAEIRNRLFTPEAVQVQLGERYTYHLKLKERKRDRWKIHLHYLAWYLRLMMTPNQMDRDVVKLPRFLYPLYFVTRPVRLIYTYLRPSIHNPGKKTWGRV